ncbi:MAG: hypothetical protein LBV15_06170 [Planctomycetota bacterium]|jgi:hypothetical protein|nr:hypothetical protein [Planctomycetota bacterium]
MPGKNGERGKANERIRRLRARVIGVGFDAAGGHVRLTTGDGFLLCGGSEATHGEMQRRAALIRDELERKGISLDSLAADRRRELQEIVDRLGRPRRLAGETA